MKYLNYLEIFKNDNLILYLLFGGILFFVASLGVFVLGRDLITILISFELLLLGCLINFIAFSVYHQSLVGELFIIFILVIAAAETAIALSILVLCYYTTTETVDSSDTSYADFIYGIDKCDIIKVKDYKVLGNKQKKND